jgi:hypothetical protein
MNLLISQLSDDSVLSVGSLVVREEKDATNQFSRTVDINDFDPN